MSTIAQQFGMTEALEILGVKAINEGTSTGNNHFSNGDILESYSPVDGQLSISAIYSHAAAYLGHGLPISDIGPVVAHFTRKLVIQPVITSQQIRATIIHIDHFENVVVNLKKETFERVRNDRSFALYYKQNDPITFLCKDYGDVAIGDALAFFNTAGYLEIAINMDKASSMLNLFKNEMIQINFY